MSILCFLSSSRTSSSILFMSLMPDASSSMLEDRYSYLSSSFSLINSTSLIASSAIIASSPSSSDTLNSWNSCPERKGLCYGIVSNWYSRLRSSWCIWWLNSCFQWSHCSFSFPELPHGLCSDLSDIHILQCERNWWFPSSFFFNVFLHTGQTYLRAWYLRVHRLSERTEWVMFLVT